MCICWQVILREKTTRSLTSIFGEAVGGEGHPAQNGAAFTADAEVAPAPVA
jgi:hypothetical protein